MITTPPPTGPSPHIPIGNSGFDPTTALSKLAEHISQVDQTPYGQAIQQFLIDSTDANSPFMTYFNTLKEGTNLDSLKEGFTKAMAICSDQPSGEAIIHPLLQALIPETVEPYPTGLRTAQAQVGEIFKHLTQNLIDKSSLGNQFRGINDVPTSDPNINPIMADASLNSFADALYGPAQYPSNSIDALLSGTDLHYWMSSN